MLQHPFTNLTCLLPSFDLFFSLILGYYVYIETSYPRKNGDKAWLVSSVLPPAPKGKCLNFYYHMYGADINLLRVYVKPTLHPLGKVLWTRTGNQGNVWRHGLADIKSTSSFKVRYTTFVLTMLDIKFEHG